MPVDTSIYNALLQRPKSVAEYDAEAMQGQQNRLALQATRMQMQDRERGMAQENALAQAWRDATGADGTTDRNKLYNGAAQAGLGAKLPGIQKGFAELDETAAKTAKQNADTQETLIKAVNLKMGQARDLFTTIQSPDQAVQLIRGMYADPDLGKLFAMKGDTVDAAVSRIPTEPQAFAEWLQAASLNAEKLATYRTPDANAKLQSDTSLTNNRASIAARAAESGADRAEQRRQFGIREGRQAQEFGARLALDKSKPVDGSAKPMPTAALKMQQAELDAIGIAGGIQADLGAVEKQIESGKLDFGPVNNLIDKGRNLAGMSTEASRNKASFKSSLEKLRNDSLRLNAGVQTDGDAQRAWNELFENINDKGVVKQRLGEIKRLNERAVKMRKMNVDGIRANYGRDPVDTSGYENQTPAIGGKTAPNIDALLDKYK